MTIEIFTPEPFDTEREAAINDVFYPYLLERVGKDRADNIARGLRSPHETSALLLDCLVLYKQKQTRINNYSAKQLFSETVSNSKMIDLIVKRYGLERQVLEPEDTTTFPIKPAVLESNESLLLRYSLAPYGLSTTGTRTGYRFHCLTLGERPVITVSSEGENTVVVKYEFSSTQGIERPKDADVRTTEPYSGKVQARVLSHAGSGQPSQALMKTVLEYLSRPDIAQETDELTVKGAEVVDYEIEIEAKEISKPNQLVNRAALNKALEQYAKEQHKLGGAIERTRLIQIVHNHNGETPQIIKPESDLICEWFQAPFCVGISTNVRPREI
ncbi:Baseplate_J domain-containing protein [Vibrio chagasii]|nr:Baseplate_J domain-containing protein [Vibrio chagasii]